MNKEQLQEQINQFKEQINNITGGIDFSKWIGRDEDRIAIKGDKYLISYPDGSILYGNVNKNNFTDKITYRVGTLKDLKQGDVFILKKDLNDIKIKDFNIFIAKDAEDKYIFQYLIKYLGVEQIEYFSNPWYHYEEVIIFNRK